MSTRNEYLPAEQRPRRRSARGSNPDQLPPHSPEAETGILGCVLLEPLTSMNHCEEMAVAPDWFYDLRHQVIWSAMQGLHRQGKGIDLITLTQVLRDQGQLEEVGGMVHLSTLPDEVPSAANLPQYVATAHEKWMARTLIRTCSAAVSDAFEQKPGELEGVISRTEKELWSLAEEGVSGREVALLQLVVEEQERLERHYTRGRAQMGGLLASGLDYLDKLLGGYGGANGNYIVISARPGIGKTSLATQLGMYASIDYTWWEPELDAEKRPVVVKDKDGRDSYKFNPRQGMPVHVFTLEMKAEALTRRMLFQRAKADMQRFRTGFAVQEDWDKLAEAGKEIARGKKMLIDDTGRCTIDSLKAKARRSFRQHGTKLFIVDYIQLLTTSTKRFREDRVQELAEISAELQNLGKELNVPVLVLAQMNRDYEKEPNRAPRLSDLKDCGSIEQDADVVMFLHTPRMTKETEASWESQAASVYGADWSRRASRVDCLVAKNRYGPIGHSKLLFHRAYTGFSDYQAWLKAHGFAEPAKGESRRGTTPLPTNEELGI